LREIHAFSLSEAKNSHFYRFSAKTMMVDGQTAAL
jgi:hypothetical protein